MNATFLTLVLTTLIAADPSTDKHPHPLNRNRLLVIVHRDAEDQLGKIAGLERVAPLKIGNPESFRRFTVQSLAVV